MELEKIRSWWQVPNIAFYCSLFRSSLNLPVVDIEDLEKGLLSDDFPDNIVLDLIIRLLGGYFGTEVGPSNYDLYLSSFLEYELKKKGEPNPCGDKGFYELNVGDRVEVLSLLCQGRLDANDAPEALKGRKGESMRVEPLGVDGEGATYWYFFGTRLYKELPVPVVPDAPKKRGRKKKNSGDVPQSQKMLKPEEEEEGENTETFSTNRSARLHVDVVEQDVDEEEEEEMDIGLEDDVESLKFDSMSEEEGNDVLFDDHSSDEDYSEKGPKKRKRGKKGDKSVSKTPKRTKTAKGKGNSSIIPFALSNPPKSARLQAKYGIKHEDSNSTSNGERRPLVSADITKFETPKRGRGRPRKIRPVVVEKSEPETCRHSDTADKEGAIVSVDSDGDGRVENSTVDKMEVDSKYSEPVSQEAPDANVSKQNGDTADERSHSSEGQQLDCQIGSAGDSICEAEPDSVLSKDYTKIVEDEASGKNEQGGASTSEDDRQQESPDRDAMDCESGTEETETSSNVTPVDENSTKNVNTNGQDEEQKVKTETESCVEQDEKYLKDKTKPRDQKSDDSIKPALIKAEEEMDQDPDNTHLSVKVEPDHLDRKLQDLHENADLKMDFRESKDSIVSAVDNEKSKPENTQEPCQPTDASSKTGWSLVCDTVEEWQCLVATLSQSKDPKDKKLCNLLRNNFLDEIPRIYEEKEKQRKQRELEMAPRRWSSRLQRKKLEQDDRDCIIKESEEQENMLRALEEEERKRRQEKERKEEQERQKRERELAKEKRAERARLREERARLLAEGKEIPPELMNGSKSNSPVPEEQVLDEEVAAKLYKVLTVCFKNNEAYPFEEDVDEAEVPDYYEIIKNPMNLNKMEEKLKTGQYSSKEEFAADMDLIVDNCLLYNGETSEYTKMVQTLKNCFQRSMRRFFPAPRARNDDEDFVFRDKAVRVGDRYRVRREASKKALNTFSEIAEEGENDEIVPVGPSAGQKSSTIIRVPLPAKVSISSSASASTVGVRVVESKSQSSPQQILITVPSTTGAGPSGQQHILVRTVNAAGQNQTVLVPRQAVVGSSGSNQTATTRGGQPAGRYIISGGMVSILKNRPQEASHVFISRPQAPQPIQMVSNIHQSGATVRPVIPLNASGVVGQPQANTSSVPIIVRQQQAAAPSGQADAASSESPSAQAGSKLAQKVMTIPASLLSTFQFGEKIKIVQGPHVVQSSPQLVSELVPQPSVSAATARSPVISSGNALTLTPGVNAGSTTHVITSAVRPPVAVIHSVNAGALSNSPAAVNPGSTTPIIISANAQPPAVDSTRPVIISANAQPSTVVLRPSAAVPGQIAPNVVKKQLVINPWSVVPATMTSSQPVFTTPICTPSAVLSTTTSTISPGVSAVVAQTTSSHALVCQNSHLPIVTVGADSLLNQTDAVRAISVTSTPKLSLTTISSLSQMAITSSTAIISNTSCSLPRTSLLQTGLCPEGTGRKQVLTNPGSKVQMKPISVVQGSTISAPQGTALAIPSGILSQNVARSFPGNVAVLASAGFTSSLPNGSPVIALNAAPAGTSHSPLNVSSQAPSNMVNISQNPVAASSRMLSQLLVSKGRVATSSSIVVADIQNKPQVEAHPTVIPVPSVLKTSMSVGSGSSVPVLRGKNTANRLGPESIQIPVCHSSMASVVPQSVRTVSSTETVLGNISKTCTTLTQGTSTHFASVANSKTIVVDSCESGPQTCLTSPQKLTPSPMKEGSEAAVSGRSRRKVVNRNYKELAGFGRKSMSTNSKPDQEDYDFANTAVKSSGNLRDTCIADLGQIEVTSPQPSTHAADFGLSPDQLTPLSSSRWRDDVLDH